MTDFNLSRKERKRLWSFLRDTLENYYGKTRDFHLAPALDPHEIRTFVKRFTPDEPISTKRAIEFVLEGLTKYHMQVSHPGYLGLFNPRPNFPSILADVLTATFNPQLAAWSHSPFAVEAEISCIREMGKKFGYPPDQTDGTFTTGGAEANLTAVQCALNHQFPNYGKIGALSLTRPATIYCSSGSHHSVGKAARVSGIGLESIRMIPVDEDLKMNASSLKSQIANDRKAGYLPFMIVATAGTTGSGAIDPLHEISLISQTERIWFHVDAAYGGAAILSKDHQHHLQGISAADSITFDVHKWMSVPMGASLYLTRHPNILSETFAIRTDYMPKEGDTLDIVDPYVHSIQWSRRFIGLKMYLSLLTFGWKGYQDVISHQIDMGLMLEEVLLENQWQVYNNTPLPVTCFSDPKYELDPSFADQLCKEIADLGKFWVSPYPTKGVNTIRACICNYMTRKADIMEFLDLINTLRDSYKISGVQ